MKKFLKRLLGRQREVEADLNKYLENLSTIAFGMRKAIRAYLEGDMAKFSTLFEHINELENRLDTLRRDIEAEIYGRRLLPDTRGDILGLLEHTDKIPNRMQSTVREINLQKPQIPQSLHESFNDLLDRGSQIIQVLVHTAQAFLNNPHKVKAGVEQLSYHEHEGDMIEQRAVALTFDDPSLELAHKMQLHRLIERLGSICDMAEDVGDRIMVSALKRLL